MPAAFNAACTVATDASLHVGWGPPPNTVPDSGPVFRLSPPPISDTRMIAAWAGITAVNTAATPARETMQLVFMAISWNRRGKPGTGNASSGETYNQLRTPH